MEDRSNIIKEAIEYRNKLEKKVEELAQSVVRLQISLDFADNTIKKKDRENAELKAENARQKSCLREIKAIAENSCCMTDKDFCSSNSCTVCKSVSDADVIKQILQLINESEDE